MSRLFYDHLLNLDELEKRVKKITKDKEEQHEIFRLVDEIVHHRVIGCILHQLPDEHHQDFLHKVSERPHDRSIISFLRERIAHDIEEFIKLEIHRVAIELLKIVADETAPKKKIASKSHNG